MIHHYSAVISQEDSFFVAYCPELDVTSQGKTFEETENNLKEAIELYIESFGTEDIRRPHPPIITTVTVETSENA